MIIPKAQSGMIALIAVCVCTALASTSSAMAEDETITRSFEIGPAKGMQKSVTLSFTIPSDVQVFATITYKRQGPSGALNDIPVLFSARNPKVPPLTQGTTLDQQTVTAKLAQQTLTLLGHPTHRSDSGCTEPWTMLVMFKQQSTQVVNGTVTLRYSNTPKKIYAGDDFSNIKMNVPKGTSVSHGIFFFPGSGTIRIKAEWHTSLLEIMHFNTYYKLTVRLLMNNTVVATQSGYSQHAPSDKTPKLNLTYLVKPANADASTNWKIEVESSAPADIVDFVISKDNKFESTMTPGC